MSQIAIYWEALNAIHNLTTALWIGSIFYFVFGLQSCFGLLDPTQKTSLQLQSLRKLFQFNWINSILVLISQAGLLLHSSNFFENIAWSPIAASILVIIMIVIQFYVFTSHYRKARRAIRPKPAVFTKINSSLKLIVFFGIITLVLQAF